MSAVANAERKNAVSLPWAITTTGMSILIKEWNAAVDGRALAEAKNLNKEQWSKVCAIVKKLKKRGVKMKELKFRAEAFDGLDFDMLKKVANDVGR